MKVLVACEFSGVVRDAFLWAGHQVVSCDFLPTEKPGHHVQGDVREMLRQSWDLVISHPPCTYLANSGVRWLHERPERWELLRESAAFFRQCLNANASMIAVENPTMHRHGIELVGVKPSFAIQPYEFGHEESKRTCFWTVNLPPLMPTAIMQKRNHKVHLTPPSKERWKIRSRTPSGIAAAMAEQWGNL